MKWTEFRNLGKHRPIIIHKIYIHSPHVIGAWTHVILKHYLVLPPGPIPEQSLHKLGHTSCPLIQMEITKRHNNEIEN